MIDPGDPFLPGHGFEDLSAALQDSVRLGVQHEDLYRTVFDPALFVYDLGRETTEVVRVTGLVSGRFLLFEPGRDYTASLSRVVWRRRLPAEPDQSAPRYPDPRSTFEVTFRFREPASGLTDFGPGSVVSTLLRAVGREIALLYQQMNEAYRRAFLDTASGFALDSVVALLGVTRNPAQKATGSVRFSRRQAGTRLVVPRGTRVEDAARRRFSTTSDAALEPDDTEADATVEAAEAGPGSNVGADAVVVMPTPPPGVDAVTNPLPVTGGEEPEPDDALRERARHWLERRGNATPGAIEYAVRDVDGVEDVVVIDSSVDPDVRLGEVRVRYSTAAGSPQRQGEIDVAVAEAVEATRAAGVVGIPERVRTVSVSGLVVVLPADTGSAGAGAAYADQLVRSLGTMAIGAALSVRRLTALVYAVPGLADVAEPQLTFARDTPLPGFPQAGQVGDVLPVDRAEQVVPGDVSVAVVTGLAAAGVGPREVSVQLLAGGVPVPFTAYVAPLRLQVRARLLATPTLPPVVLVDLPKQAAFTGTDTAAVGLTAADLSRFDPGVHAPTVTVAVELSGFAAVPPATAQLTVA